MGFELVGRVWTLEEFEGYVRGLDLSWVRGVTLHHTSAPSLEQRPEGLKAQHIVNIRDYYKNRLGWSSGPHLFIDDDQIWGMSSLERRGIHARSFNATHIGVEVLGDYDREPVDQGRGKACWETTSKAVGSILRAAGLPRSAVNGHRDDPKTSKTCPGVHVDLDQFRQMLDMNPVPGRGAVEDREDDVDYGKILDGVDWQLQKLRKALT